MPFLFRLSPLLMLALFSSLGCGGAPADVGAVTGLVTLDNAPLASALVEFHSLDRADVGIARTGDDGRFTMMYVRDVQGAKVGKYRVRITTYVPGNNEVDPPLPPKPERLPSKYTGQDSELEAEVKPGENDFTFPLDSNGEVVQPVEET